MKKVIAVFVALLSGWAMAGEQATGPLAQYEAARAPKATSAPAPAVVAKVETSAATCEVSGAAFIGQECEIVKRIAGGEILALNPFSLDAVTMKRFCHALMGKMDETYMRGEAREFHFLVDGGNFGCLKDPAKMRKPEQKDGYVPRRAAPGAVSNDVPLVREQPTRRR